MSPKCTSFTMELTRCVSFFKVRQSISSFWKILWKPFLNFWKLFQNVSNFFNSNNNLWTVCYPRGAYSEIRAEKGALFQLTETSFKERVWFSYYYNPFHSALFSLKSIMCWSRHEALPFLAVYNMPFFFQPVRVLYSPFTQCQ